MAESLPTLGGAELSAIAGLWRRERRRLTTSFSGASMSPAIHPGQTVEVDCGAEPAVGDVAVFRLREQVGVHRVVARGAGWLLTWGDANALPDEPVEPAQVLGVVLGAAAPVPPGRARLARLLAAPRLPLAAAARRVRLAHRLRNAWRLGPAAFAGKALAWAARRVASP